MEYHELDKYIENIKNRINKEFFRRSCQYGGVSEHQIQFDIKPVQGQAILSEHKNELTSKLLLINDFSKTEVELNRGKTEPTVIDAVFAEAGDAISEYEKERVYIPRDEALSTSCRGMCTGMCSGSCFNTCDGCTGSCVGSCSSCTGHCSSSCGSSCSTSCSGGCSTICQGGCGSSCSDTCSSACSGGCAGGCSGCAGSCQGRCQGTCSGGCDTSCSGSCDGTCDQGCYQGCTVKCGAGCSGRCELSCSGGCNGTCGSGCAKGTTSGGPGDHVRRNPNGGSSHAGNVWTRQSGGSRPRVVVRSNGRGPGR